MPIIPGHLKSAPSEEERVEQHLGKEGGEEGVHDEESSGRSSARKKKKD